MTLFSDGIAARLLVLNLIRQLELKKVLDPSTTDCIFKASIEQASNFISKLPECKEADNEADSDSALVDLEKASIEEAIVMLEAGAAEVAKKRAVN
jgi:hypothetical protein